MSEHSVCERRVNVNRFRMHFAKAAGVLDAILPAVSMRLEFHSEKSANCNAIVGECTGSIALRKLRVQKEKVAALLQRLEGQSREIKWHKN